MQKSWKVSFPAAHFLFREVYSCILTSARIQLHDGENLARDDVDSLMGMRISERITTDCKSVMTWKDVMCGQKEGAFKRLIEGMATPTLGG